ncbi:hypothetical protein MKD33_17715, partial [Chromobacterium piscinae]
SEKPATRARLTSALRRYY